jgi:hypothetical protein
MLRRSWRLRCQWAAVRRARQHVARSTWPEMCGSGPRATLMRTHKGVRYRLRISCNRKTLHQRRWLCHYVGVVVTITAHSFIAENDIRTMQTIGASTSVFAWSWPLRTSTCLDFCFPPLPPAPSPTRRDGEFGERQTTVGANPYTRSSFARRDRVCCRPSRATTRGDGEFGERQATVGASPYTRSGFARRDRVRCRPSRATTRGDGEFGERQATVGASPYTRSGFARRDRVRCRPSRATTRGEG